MEHRSGGPPALARGVVHVWSAPVDQPPAFVSRFLPTLSPDERNRAAQIPLELDRVRFIVSRGLLRSILASYLEIPPARVEFSYGPHGKPALSKRLPTRTLTFNASRSQQYAMFAVAVGRAVGIDVERVRSLANAREVVETTCSQLERAVIDGAPADARDERLLAYWTCKEAYTKARGDGASHPLSGVEVALDAEGQAQFLRVDGSEREAAHWRVQRVSPEPGYVGAVVVEGHDWVLARMDASLS